MFDRACCVRCHGGDPQAREVWLRIARVWFGVVKYVEATNLSGSLEYIALDKPTQAMRMLIQKYEESEMINFKDEVLMLCLRFKVNKPTKANKNKKIVFLKKRS